MYLFYPNKLLLAGTRWLDRHIYLGSILALAAIDVAQAVPNIWYLDGVQFNTDTTAVGSFIYDTNTYSTLFNQGVSTWNL